MSKAEQKRKDDALRIVAHYYCWIQKPSGQGDVADTLRISSSDFGNFLASRSDAHAEEIRAALKPAVTVSRFLHGKPGWLLAAINEAYDLHVMSGVESVFDQIAESDPATSKKLVDCYGGLWNAFRYGAHDEVKARKLSNGEWDAYVIRTSLFIDPQSGADGEFPTFRIDYKPWVPSGESPVKTTAGSVVPLRGGAYMAFYGVEKNTEYPLDIRAPRFKDKVDFFYGLVKRHLEGGDVVTSRVAFVRSAAKKIEDLHPKLGMKLESELIAEARDEIPGLSKMLEAVVNDVAYGGKCSLWLWPKSRGA